jgi:hypothetical protein
MLEPDELFFWCFHRIEPRGSDLWPKDKWPPMRFDRPLCLGARGGPGPIHYSIKEDLANSQLSLRNINLFFITASQLLHRMGGPFDQHEMSV